MNCRVCRLPITGETTTTAPVPIITPAAYILMVNCPCCSASLAFVMSMSESEALQRHAEEERYQRHRAAFGALTEARKRGAAWSELRRLEREEERWAYAE